jgi:restriction system protein
MHPAGGREVAPTVPVQTLFCTSCGARVSPEMASCTSCTAKAQGSIDELSNVLLETIKIDHKVDWEATAKQYKIPKPAAPTIRPLSKKPDVADFEYRPSFLISLIPSIRKKRSDYAQQRFLQAKTAWNKEKVQIDAETARDNNEYQHALNKWEADKKAFDEAEAAISESKQKLYFGKDPTALKEYWETAISQFKIPAGLTTNCIFTYFEDRRTLVVDCGLPSFDSIPKAQEVRYAANKKAFEEILFPRSWQDDFYERVIYNITLKTLYELFQSDSANALETVVLNGFVRAIDRAIGHEVKAYIISVQAMKQEFLAITRFPKALTKSTRSGRICGL